MLDSNHCCADAIGAYREGQGSRKVASACNSTGGHLLRPTAKTKMAAADIDVHTNCCLGSKKVRVLLREAPYCTSALP